MVRALLNFWHTGRGSGAGLASGPVTAGAGTSSRCRCSLVPTRHFSPVRTEIITLSRELLQHKPKLHCL
uniref:Uncharacterized protein n=1 Tax=Chelonoidis abingdonii TaxID=106734 RepID=A0A8C0GFQ9_CHEAB